MSRGNLSNQDLTANVLTRTQSSPFVLKEKANLSFITNTTPRTGEYQTVPSRGNNEGETLGCLSGWAASWPKGGWATKIVRQGLSWPWITRPPLVTPRKSASVSQSVVPHISEMLEKKVIERTSGKVFLSRLFTVPKKGSDRTRLVMDLSSLNKYIKHVPFKMVTVAQVRTTLCRGDWLASIDLKDAYWHIPIHPRFRKFLAFQVGEVTFQFTRLPFGLSLAPRVFTKVTRVVSNRLAEKGFDVPRRLASVLPFQGANSSQCKDHSTGFGRNGMAVKLPQIQIESHTNDNLARYQMVNFRCHHPCARQRCKDTTSSQGMQFLQNTVTPPVRTDVGYHKLCCTRATTRKAEAQEVDTGSEQTLPKVPKGCSTTSSSHPFTPPKTVAPIGDFAEMCPLVKPGAVVAGVHRRIGRGLGIPIESGSPSMWGMDKGATLAFHKLQGTVRSEGVAAQNPDSAGHCGKVRHGQLHSSSLHKKAGNITLRVTPVSVRRYFPTRPASSHLPVSAVCPRHRERLGGCPLALPGNLSRVEPQTTSVRLTGDSIRSSPNRSLCIKENRSARGLPDILTQDSGWGSRRLRGRLEQVGFHLPFSSTSDHSPLESDPQAEVLPGQGFVHSPLLASSTLVQRTCRGLPASSPTRFSLPHRQPCLTSSDITASSRVDFLRKGLQRQFSGEAVEALPSDHLQSGNMSLAGEGSRASWNLMGRI